MLRSIASFALVEMAGIGLACAQSYPHKPIRLVTSGIGAGADTLARLLAPGFSDASHQRAPAAFAAARVGQRRAREPASREEMPCR
jgi:tripartite-type tricarboxylate transporter receptor subunit TctC